MTGDLLVIARIAGRRCALAALDVKSVIEIGTVTPIPRAPAWIAGITALRSQALTVIDCRRALGLGGVLAADEWATDHRAVVVAEGGHSYALMVDSIEDITTAAGEAGQVIGTDQLWEASLNDAGYSLFHLNTMFVPASVTEVTRWP